MPRIAWDAALTMQGRAREQLARPTATPFQQPPLMTSTRGVLMGAAATDTGVGAGVGAGSDSGAGIGGGVTGTAATGGGGAGVGASALALRDRRRRGSAVRQRVDTCGLNRRRSAAVMRPVAQQPGAPQRSALAQPMSAHSAAVRDAVRVPQRVARRQ